MKVCTTNVGLVKWFGTWSLNQRSRVRVLEMEKIFAGRSLSLQWANSQVGSNLVRFLVIGSGYRWFNRDKKKKMKVCTCISIIKAPNSQAPACELKPRLENDVHIMCVWISVCKRGFALT